MLQRSAWRSAVLARSGASLRWPHLQPPMQQNTSVSAMSSSRFMARRWASGEAMAAQTEAFEPPVEVSKASTSTSEKGRRTGFLYFSSVFPIRLGWWDARYLVSQAEKQTWLDKLSSMVPRDSAFSSRVEEVVAMDKDGGAYVKFSFIPPRLPSDPEEMPLDKEKEALILQAVEKEAKDALAARVDGGLFRWTWGTNDVFLVRGKPWVEDMSRFPNKAIRIEFEGPDVPQEELYKLLRPYGRIHDIVPATPDAKPPRTATVIFTSMRAAASARNCLHGSVYGPTTTKLRILYVDRVRAHFVWGWLTGHPRIVLPLLVALIGSLSWLIFDPVRAWFVKTHIDGTWDSKRWAVIRWVKSETLQRLGLGKSHKDQGPKELTGIEKEREEAEARLGGWVRGSPESFIVVTGPRGSGKTRLVDKVIEAESANVLTIDCAKLCKEGRTDDRLVSELASATGYWPQFAFLSSLNNLIDLASVGLIGSKAGFSSSLDAQLKQVLEVTSTALKQLANDAQMAQSKALERSDYARETSDARARFIEQMMTGGGIRDGRMDCVAGNGAMSELGLGLEKPPTDGEWTIIGPHSASTAVAWSCVDFDQEGEVARENARLPIVVIKGFAAKGEAKHEVLWEVLADWAAVVVENQVAHVIFTSDSVSVSKPLAKAYPNKPFNTIALNDAPLDSAVQYIESKLKEMDKSLEPGSKPSVSRLGGRQTDLELLVQKIRAGQSAEEAVEDIVARSATEIRKNILGDDREEAKSFKWKRKQAWALGKRLAKDDEVKYAEVLINSPFEGDEAALRALEQSEMISVHHHEGRPSIIMPGKPVYKYAFQRLLADPVFRASMEWEINQASQVSVKAEIAAASKEMIELTQLFGGPNKWILGGGSAPPEVVRSVEGLLGVMRDNQAKLDKLGKEAGELKEILTRDK